MNEILKGWLAELKEEELVCDPADIRRETNNNFWSFSFPQRTNVDVGDAVGFFEAIAEQKAEQVIGKMTYYVWYDDMSHHLCYCIASVNKDSLPFRCTVVHIEELHEVVSQYFDEENGDHVPIDELKEISIEKAFSEDEEETEYKLKVWSKELSATFHA